MFDPSQADVRKFFCELWRKHKEAMPLTPLEAIALDWVLEHPESFMNNMAVWCLKTVRALKHYRV